MNDLDKIYPNGKLPNLSIDSLKCILKNNDATYVDNGDVCKHDIGGSVPDFKKIFVTEFIWAREISLNLFELLYHIIDYLFKKNRFTLTLISWEWKTIVYNRCKFVS